MSALVAMFNLIKRYGQLYIHLLIAVFVGYVVGIAISGTGKVSDWSTAEIAVWAIATVLTLLALVIGMFVWYLKKVAQMANQGCPSTESKLADKYVKRLSACGNKTRAIVETVDSLSEHGIHQGIVIPKVGLDGYLRFLERVLNETRRSYWGTSLFSPGDFLNNPRLGAYVSHVAEHRSSDKIRILIERNGSDYIQQAINDVTVMQQFGDLAYGTNNKVDHWFVDEKTLTDMNKLGVSVISDYVILDDEILVTYDRSAMELCILCIATFYNPDGSPVPVGGEYRLIFERVKDNYAKRHFRHLGP